MKEIEEMKVFVCLACKVRSMWTLIIEMLTSLKKEKQAVDSVLEDCAGQCILDGTNVAFSVPRLLAHRVESDIQQLCMGSVYEAEKLNFLTVIQLLNEALRTLRDEHCQWDLKQLQAIEDRRVLCNEILQQLAHCMSVSGLISKEQEDWEEKWKSFLGVCPFNLFLAHDRNKGIVTLLSQDLPFSNILQVAKSVVSESPQNGEGKGMALEDLISSLSFNPFLVRKEIPRTPENLPTEISSSWTKAVETEGSSDTELAPTEVMLEEAPMDARPTVQKLADSRFMCSIPASPVPNCDPPLSDRKSQVSSTEFRPQEQMSISHITESPVSETSGKQESERTEAQELKCIVLNKSAVEDPEEETFQYVNKSLNTPDTCSENNNVTNVLPSDHFQGSLVDGMLHSNLYPFLSRISSETGYVGILDESLPKCLDLIDLDKSVSSESDFDVVDSASVTGGSENKDDIQKSELDPQSLLNMHKELKKTASGSEEELHQTHNGNETVSDRSDQSLAPEKRGRDGLCSPLELFKLDEEFTKTSSPSPLDERKYSLLLTVFQSPCLRVSVACSGSSNFMSSIVAFYVQPIIYVQNYIFGFRYII
uniref:Uncharacterized protein n=1 Tax=Accipiter nisus TaxID=211598 RepID=A0A8B9N545_9AVES